VSAPRPGDLLGKPPASVPPDGALANADLVVDYSSSWEGLLEPCGCTQGQYGGVSRRATALQQQSLGNRNQLPVFAGDFSVSASDEARLKAEVAYRAMAAMGFQAIALGEGDFLHGLPFVRAQIKAYPDLFVCANLRDSATGLPLCRPYVTRTYASRGGGSAPLRVAVTAFLGPGLLSQVPLASAKGRGVRALDPISVARTLIPKLRAQADVVIALCHDDADEVSRLLKAVPGIDLAVLGHSTEYTVSLEGQVGRTALVANTDRGRFVCQAALTRSPSGLRVRGRQLTLSEGYPENARLAVLRDSYKPKLDAMMGGAISAREMAPTALLLPVANGNRFVGSAACAPCHREASLVWLASAHARALKTLHTTRGGVNASRPDCLRCHTVGFGQPTGFGLLAPQEALGGVGCESCHGPGAKHVAQASGGSPSTGSISRDPGPGAKLCGRCHDKDNSPAFSYGAYVAKIRHWGEGFPTLRAGQASG
jgi:hypothetical protein